MLVPMLEAIAEMLKDTKETEVKCAKIMLDKVIEGMKEKEAPFGLQPHPDVPSIRDIQKRTVKKEGDVQIVVEHGKITNVLNAREDTRIELDGKEYGWQETIGKSFSTGRVV